jgi:gliding motility-associated-like protein
LKITSKSTIFIFLFLYFNNTFAQLPTDCFDAVIACGNSNINLDVSGIGTQELSGSNTCASQENNSVWLKVTLVTGGTLGFKLTPNSTSITEDYDFFVFGPDVSCGNIGQAIRCSTTNPQAAGQKNNLTGMNSTSTDVSEGPGPDGDSFVKWLDVLPEETYYIVIDRPIGNSPFSLEWTGTATFAEPPSDQSIGTGTSTDLESCDITAPFNNGFTSFNLENNTNLIKGSQTDVVITYHKTASDANIGINSLTSPYTNVTNPQTIYARITNMTSGCFELTNFDLNVNLGPDYVKPSDYILCEDLNDGDITNGRVIFNLESKNTEILNGQNVTDFNITYYHSENDAETKNAPISNLYYNTTPFNEEIFIRIEDVLNSNCKSITSLNLVVNLNPEAFNVSILQCDEDGLKDGISLFNLNQAINDLTGSIPNRSTKFYTDNTRLNEIQNPNSFLNTSSTQTIYVEVINDDTGCLTNSELILNVSVTDSNDTQLLVCDDDGNEDGFHSFNLFDANTQIIKGLSNGLTISYYETYQDALIEQNNLSSNYINTAPYSQTIFARVENANDCYGISRIELKVDTLPNINTEESTIYCLNTFPETITIDAGLINDSPLNYTYNWSTGETSYDIKINNPGVYSVIVSNVNNCSKERTVVVEAANIATFESINVVDATQNNIITVLVSGEGIYEYSLLDSNNMLYRPYQSSNVFENIFPGFYTVYVKDVKNNCGSVNTKVSVIGFPKYFTPNNDGVNDTWQVYGVSNMFQPNSKIFIFDRLGKLIKQLNPSEKGWDGTFNGKILPTDDYWFSVTLQDGRIFKSHFTLKK